VAQPTSRDDVIRADLARGVPAGALSEEWGLDPIDVTRIGAGIPVLPYEAEPAPGRDLVVRTAGGRLINPYDPDLPDPDARRDPRAAEYERERLSENTRLAYRRYIGQYLDFCALTGRREVPANRATLEAFTIWLAQRPVTKGKNAGKTGLAPQSIGVALAAVRALHEACGENPPDRRLANRKIEGHRKMRAKDRTIHDDVGSPGVDLPTFADLVAACPADTNAGLRDRAMLTLGLNIMARRSELCILDLGDIKVERDGWLSVYVHETKTGKPRTAKVPAWDHLPALCPKRAWLAWKARLAERGATEGAAFRGVDRWDNIQGVGAWAGRAELGSRLDGSTLEHIIARAAIRAQVENPHELSPHGVLRRTGATQAYLAGADVLAIARQGGWGDKSPVVFRYIADVDMKKRNPMLLIGRNDD
jgi:site-specific recombinase XerC